jgi:hypothetical protein
MICKIGIKWTTLAALTCKLATVNPAKHPSLLHLILHSSWSADDVGDLGFTGGGIFVEVPLTPARVLSVHLTRRHHKARSDLPFGGELVVQRFRNGFGILKNC